MRRASGNLVIPALIFRILDKMNLRQMPKAELHRHLELTLRPETIKELAPQFGIELPNEAAFKERFLITEPMADLGSALNKFLDTQSLLASTEILERITYEACEDAYHEGILLLELRYAPTFVQLNHEHLSFDQIHQAIVQGVEKAQKAFPMAVGLLCIIQRILPVKEAEAVTEFAIEHKDTFVGLDLADNEVGFDSKPFAPFFQKAKDSGLGITIHSGEANVPKAPRYVRDAIDYLGATRIGHGVQIYRDPEMMDYAKKQEITFELCPTSNWLTNSTGPVENHPFRTLFDYGLKTTINTDDPGIFGVDLTHEYQILKDHHHFTREELEKCADFAAQSSFVPLEKKQAVWPRPLHSI